MLNTTGRARGLCLRSALPQARFFGAADELLASAVAIDPQRVRAGEAFVALTGASGDTHDDVEVAIERGAAAVVAERYLPIDIPQVIVPDSREALGRLCHDFAGRPTDTLNTIGVAGTQGKTVTTLLIAAVLEAARQSSGVLSTIGYSDGCEQVEARATTPTAPEAAQWLERMKIVGCRNAILEVSRLALAERRLAAAQFDALVLTSMRPSATDDFRSIQNERQLHASLFNQLKTSGFVVANADDANVQGMLGSLACPVMTYSLRGEGEVTATVLERHVSEQTFLLHAGHVTMPVRTEMIGDHHVLNCLAAAAVGLVMGLDLPTIARGLESQHKMPGRLERLECGQEFSCFVDYARTPETLAASLKAVRQVTKGRVWCVLGAEGERHKELRPQLCRVVERMADHVILTSDNPRGEEPKQIVHQILDGMTDVGAPRVMPNRAKAIEWALSHAAPGDSVVIAGKGDANEQIIGRKRQRHDDRDLARQLLYGKSEPREFPRLAKLD
jgi:UDP-N-acetylmuramoyl-L-alanyl-D-glutamate--2,6-diaminopimelate ligase